MGAVADISRRFFGDRLTNYLTGIGNSRDKATGSYYTSSLMSPQQLEDAYRFAWLPRKIVDIPAKDACRNWRSWNGKPEQISALETEERRLNLRGNVRLGMIRGRLYGGAALMIGTGESALQRELVPDNIGRGGLKYVALIPRRYLTAGDIETDPASPLFMTPRFYTYGGTQGAQVQVHPSRLVMFQGNPLPDPETAGAGDYGWSDSVLTAAYTACVNADSTVANIASLVFEAKVDVFRIDDLAKWLENGATKLLERFRIANIGKGINGALLLDKNEEYEQKTINFASLPEVLREFMQIVSGAADIPVTRLLGQSPGGMNSTGESDLRNYYDLVQSMQTNDIEPGLRLLDECLIRSALGDRPAEVFYNWNSLWQVSKTEQSEIAERTSKTIKTLAETNLFPQEALSAASVNMLVESGAMPGLEQEIADWVAGGGSDDADADDADAAIEREGEGQAALLGDAAPRTLYVSRKVTNGAEIAAHFAAQGVTGMLDADDLHVTIAYSRTPIDWMKVGDGWSRNEDGTLTVAAGGARLMDRLGVGGEALVLLFNSSDLAWRHVAIKDAGASWDWPDYQPHVTIAYDDSAADVSAITPWRGKIEFGPEIFQEIAEDFRGSKAGA